MTIKCPRCQSNRIEARNYGKRICGAIGTVAGATSGVTGAMGNAEIGENAGVVAGVGSLAGAVLGGLIGGGSGYAAGAALGEAIDRHILDNYHCIDCCYNFNSDHHQSNFTPSTYPINQSSLIDFNSHESRELNFD